MTIYTQTQTEQDLNKLAHLAKSGQLSHALAQHIHKLVELETSQVEIDLAATVKDLNEFEQRYGLSTADFFQQWQAGQMDDRMDYVEWASLAQMMENLRQRLAWLQNEN